MYDSPMNKLKTITCAILPVLLFITSESRSGGDDIRRCEEAVLERLHAGDDAGAYGKTIEMLMKSPLNPVSVLYYSDMAEYADIVKPGIALSDLKAVKEKIINERETPERNLCSLLVDMETEKILFPREPYKAKKVTEGLFPVRKWLISGPYRKFGAGDMNYSFPPEFIGGKENRRDLSKAILLKNFSSTLKFNDHVYPSSGIAYASTSFQIHGPVNIRIYSKYNYKAFINGREVIRNSGPDYGNLRVVRVWDTGKVTLMIKADMAGESGLRVIITDLDNRPLPMEHATDEFYLFNFSFKEVSDYPHEFFLNAVKNEKGGETAETLSLSYRYLGMYYDILDNSRASVNLRKSISLKNSPITGFMLASFLLKDTGTEPETAGRTEGWRIINELCSKDNSYIPACAKKLAEFISGTDYDRAYSEGRRLLSLSAGNLTVYSDFLYLLGLMGLDREFMVIHEKFQRAFPYSLHPLLSYAEYVKERNPQEYFSHCEMILGRKFIKKYFDDLVKHLVSRGEHDRAVELINRFNQNGAHNDSLIDMYTDKRDFRRAKELINRGMQASERPSLYYRQGLMDYYEYSDPSLYWEKMVSLNPSLFSYSDYLKFFYDRIIDNPFEKYLDAAKPLAEALKIYEPQNEALRNELGRFPSTVMYRGRTFLLSKNRTSRVFCEDVIYLNDQTGVEKWGEYRAMYRGDFHPVRMRTYHNGKEFSDSYQVRKINGENYVNLNSLRKGSVVHISYIIDNPIDTPRNSGFFSIPFELVQSYDEPLRELCIKVIAPDDIVLNFITRDNWAVKRENSNDENIYTMRAGPLKMVQSEKFSGSDLNCLPYYSFSSMTGYGDFINWYLGFIEGKDAIVLPGEMRSLQKESVEESVHEVFNYISRKVSLISNVLYYPEAPEETWYKKIGTVEDKVLLAKAVLKEMGIKSYLAFTKKRLMPRSGGFISPEIFTNILLYVPVSIGKKYWLDFSDPFNRCGAVDFNLSDEDALVILGAGHEIITIDNTVPERRVSEYTVDVNSRGDTGISLNHSFFGNYADIRKLLYNSLYVEDHITAYYISLIPGFDMMSYKIGNSDTQSVPVTISVDGESAGAAALGYKKMILQPFIQKNSINSYAIYNVRRHPLFIQTPVDDAETYRYILPSGYADAEVDKKHELSGRFGVIKISVIKKKGERELHASKEIKLLKRRIDPADYREFLDFCMNVKNLENFNAVLRQD